MPSHPDDSELLKKAQHGDTNAFGELYQRHAAAVFRYLFAHLDNRLDAEDLTNEVFLRAWQSLPRYHERGNPLLAFLFRIAHNALVDQYRRSSAAGGSHDELGNHLPDGNPGPAELLSAGFERQELLHLLGRLRADYRTVLTLRFVSDLSPEETAQVMQRSPGAVRVLQHRALERLRRLVEKEKIE
jgi:RNA polymerase sigma-70 factor (ECF subfamily)